MMMMMMMTPQEDITRGEIRAPGGPSQVDITKAVIMALGPSSPLGEDVITRGVIRAPWGTPQVDITRGVIRYLGYPWNFR